VVERIVEVEEVVVDLDLMIWEEVQEIKITSEVIVQEVIKTKTEIIVKVEMIEASHKVIETIEIITIKTKIIIKIIRQNKLKNSIKRIHSTMKIQIMNLNKCNNKMVKIVKNLNYL
jgi:hypothetical protein